MDKLIIHNKTDLPLSEILQYVTIPVARMQDGKHLAYFFEYKDKTKVQIQKNKQSFSVCVYREVK